MLQRDWVKLPIEERLELIKKYDLKRSSYSDVRGGIVYSDGFTDKDLEKVEFNNDNKNLEHERETSEQVEGVIDTGNSTKAEDRKAKRGSKK